MNTSTTAQQFHLPDVGEGLEEADIVTWHVAVGDQVEHDQIIVEIETAKALVELPSPHAGIVQELLAEPGQTVQVGAPIVTIGRGSEAPSDEAPPVLVGYGPNPSTAPRKRRKRASQPTHPHAPSSRHNTARAKPPVRHHAKQLGIDINGVTGTGAHGLVTRDDLRRHADAVKGRPRIDDRSKVDVERIPVTGVRKATAHAMSTSAFNAPHASESITVDVTRAVKLIGKLTSHPAFRDTKISILLLVARAVVAAAREYPAINASWSETEILQYTSVNLGIATATPRGLLVPNIKDAQLLTLPELAHALAALVDAARNGQTDPQDMTDGTLTITNIGVYGVDSGTPILNPGEAAILCLGALRKRPWEHKGRIALRWTTQLTLSFDHRIIDGQLASHVLDRIGRILHRPKDELLLT